MAYKRELIAQTKNLFDSNNIDTQWLGIRYKSISNGKILLNGAKEAGFNVFPVTRPNITLPVGSYTLSCRMLAGNIEGVEADFNKKIYFGINGSTYTYRCEGVGKVGDYATRTFTLTEDTLLSSFDITAGYTNNFSINNVIIECQLEKNSTATDYVPFGHLSSYKKLLKVSDVCQLLDKSKYPATMTMNGVTYTNNGDGTISVKGTRGATGDSYYRITWTQNIIKKHVYCLLGVIKNSGVEQHCLSATGAKTLNDRGSGDIETNLINRRDLIISLPVNTTVDTIVKPQLFDLTEMYGAGNEPKTVAEFKAKFPNELYDYSPRCWVKSYKTGLIAQTKNLFQYPTELVSGRDYSNSMLVEKLPNGAVLQGNPGTEPGSTNYSSGWFTPRQYAIDLDAKDVITISADYYMIEAAATYNGTIAIGLYDADGPTGDLIKVDFDKGEQYKRLSVKKVVPEAKNYYPVFSLNSSKVKITNIQIEKGSTATDYVPYGYL